MILVVTNRQDEHADFVIEELNIRKKPVARLNLDDFPQRTLLNFSIDGVSGIKSTITLPFGEIDRNTFRSIWYRRPVLPVIDPAITIPEYRDFAAKEALSAINGFLYTLNPAVWVNHPTNELVAREKMVQQVLAQNLGLRIPATLVTNIPNQAKLFFRQYDGNVIVKPLKSTSIDTEEATLAAVTHLLRDESEDVLDSISLTPCILQEYIPKELELRVTVIGDQIFAAALYSQETKEGQVDWRISVVDDLRHEAFELPDHIKQLCFAVVKSLGLNFGALDLIITPDGEYVFLEVNPNGQWVWIEHKTGMPMIDAMIKLLSVD